MCGEYKQQEARLGAKANRTRSAVHLQLKLAWGQGQRRCRIQVGYGEGGGEPVVIKCVEELKNKKEHQAVTVDLPPSSQLYRLAISGGKG